MVILNCKKYKYSILIKYPGNLGRVDFITENEYDLFVRPDTCNPRARFWFSFTVENVHLHQRVMLNLVNLGRTRSLFRLGMTPVVKSTSRPRWQRISTSQVYYYNSPEHLDQMVLSIAFSFDRENEIYSFALSYPYSYSRLQTVLKRLSKRRSDDMFSSQIIKVESIAKSLVSTHLKICILNWLGIPYLKYHNIVIKHVLFFAYMNVARAPLLYGHHN